MKTIRQIIRKIWNSDTEFYTSLATFSVNMTEKIDTVRM